MKMKCNKIKHFFSPKGYRNRKPVFAVIIMAVVATCIVGCKTEVRHLISKELLKEYRVIAPVSKEYLSKDLPMYYKDMDFDGEDELVVMYKGCGWYSSNEYDVFKFDENGVPRRLTGEPWEWLGQRMSARFTVYLPETKSIVCYFSSAGEFQYSVTYKWDSAKKKLVLSEVKDPYNLISDAQGGEVYVNSVKGHDEQDTIVGNFTGHGIDTLYVKRVVDCNCSLDKEYDKEEHYGHELDDELVKYYMVSTNPSLGQVQLYGYSSVSPQLVNEGDLDGNGTCEVGYLPVWRLSQWRIYHLFTFKDGRWKYLIDPGADVKDECGGEFLLETGHLIRGSGVEIAEPSGKKGWVLIRYQTQGIEPEIKDTLVAPDHKEII